MTSFAVLLIKPQQGSLEFSMILRPPHMKARVGRAEIDLARQKPPRGLIASILEKHAFHASAMIASDALALNLRAHDGRLLQRGTKDPPLVVTKDTAEHDLWLGFGWCDAHQNLK